MEAQARYAQVSQSMALLVLLAAIAVGAIGGFALRGVVLPATTVDAPAAQERTTLVPRSSREGYDITPYQAPAPRTTHEDDTSGR